MESINSLLARAQQLWQEASPFIRALIVVGTVLITFGIGYIFVNEDNPDLTPLAEQPLSLTQVGNITSELEKQNIPYKVTSSGTQVLVPRGRRGDLLASLAYSGVSVQPESSDLIDNGLLATDFQQKEHVRQALERSLARDIASMTAIEWAEVHISPGSDSVFSRANRSGAASVVIKIRPNIGFPKERAISLKHLVAQAAHRYGVTRDSVTVVDHEARTLAAAEDDSELGINTKALALQRETEDDLAERIRKLLEPIVGMGRVRVQVRTKMNLNRVEERAEEYDPENATVLSERKRSQAAQNQRQDPAPVVGVQGNIPQGQQPADLRGQSRATEDRAFNETNFAVPKVVRHTKRAIGGIERMSVAVLVDATAFAPPEQPPPTDAATDDDAKDDKAAPTVPDNGEGQEQDILPPRPNQEMLLALVRDAVAFDTGRGDTVTMSFQPFVRVSDESLRVVGEEPGLAIPGWLPVTIVTLLGFALIGGALYLSDKRRKQAEEEERARREAEEAENEAEETEEQPATPEFLLKDQVRELTTENVAATVEIIKGWLSTTSAKG